MTVVDGVEAQLPLGGDAIVLCVRGHAVLVAGEAALRLSGEGLAFVASGARP